MSLVGLVNLADRLLNQDSTQSQEAQAPQKAAAPQGNATTPQVAAQDQFTPSPQNGLAQNTAQDAGLFSVTQVSFFSAAAQFLLGQNTAPPSDQTAAAIPATAANPATPQNTNTDIAPAQAALTPAATNGTNAANTAVVQQPVVPITAATTTTAATANPALTQQQLQTLNQALAALGLSQQDIQQVDRIATIINDFNPSAFSALAYQLEELAQQATPQAAATATAANAQPAASNAGAAIQNLGITNTAATNTPAATGTSANGGGFQIQELVIKFSGVNLQETAQANGNANASTPNASGNTGASASFLYSAFNLQVKEVNLTLVNGQGRIARIQAPLPNGTANGAANTVATVPQTAKAANA